MVNYIKKAIGLLDFGVFGAVMLVFLLISTAVMLVWVLISRVFRLITGFLNCTLMRLTGITFPYGAAQVWVTATFFSVFGLFLYWIFTGFWADFK